MNIKVKPNKNQKIGIIKRETGITLLILILTVIILVILTTVTLIITGSGKIITGSEIAVDDFKYQEYKEQIEQVVQSIIINDSLLGKVTTVTSMAENMLNETWIMEASPNEESKDIIVIVDAGYVYQVYYNETIGEINVDHIGQEDGNSMPTITAYNNEMMIEAEAKCEGGIARIELIYKGQVIQTQNGDRASFKVEETGLYKVKAVANNGKERYVYVQITGRLRGPFIEVTSNGKKESGWYGGDGIPVEITISSEEKEVVGINYKKNTDMSYTYKEGQSAKLLIDTNRQDSCIRIWCR